MIIFILLYLFVLLELYLFLDNFEVHLTTLRVNELHAILARLEALHVNDLSVALHRILADGHVFNVIDYIAAFESALVRSRDHSFQLVVVCIGESDLSVIDSLSGLIHLLHGVGVGLVVLVDVIVVDDLVGAGPVFLVDSLVVLFQSGVNALLNLGESHRATKDYCCCKG